MSVSQVFRLHKYGLWANLFILKAKIAIKMKKASRRMPRSRDLEDVSVVLSVMQM